MNNWYSWVGNNGIIGSGASVLGAIGGGFGAYASWVNGKDQVSEMRKQRQMTENQLRIENERYEKRENERLQNNAELQSAGTAFSQAVDKQQKADLPVNRF